MFVAWQNTLFPADNAAASPALPRWLRREFSRRRIGSFAAVWPTAVAIFLALAASSGGAAESEPQASGTVPSKAWRYAQRWVARHDTDGDGRLSEAEWQSADGNLGAADANRDSTVTIDELAQHIADFGAHRRIRLMPAGSGGVVPLPSLLPPSVAGGTHPAVLQGANAAGFADETELQQDGFGENRMADHASQSKYFVPSSRLPPGLPDWFRKADRDGDAQLTFAEYAGLGSPSADKEFAKYDRNRDGLITPREVLGGSNRVQRPAKPDPVPPEKATGESVPHEKSTAETAPEETAATKSVPEEKTTIEIVPAKTITIETASPGEDNDGNQSPRRRPRPR